VQIQVLQVVLEQKLHVATLDLLAGGHVGLIDKSAIEPQQRGNEDGLPAPLRGDRLLNEVVGCVRPVAFDVAAKRAKVGPESANTSRRHVSASSAGSGGGCHRSGD
jgi:hypothetical protein